MMRLVTTSSFHASGSPSPKCAGLEYNVFTATSRPSAKRVTCSSRRLRGSVYDTIYECQFFHASRWRCWRPRRSVDWLVAKLENFEGGGGCCRARRAVDALSQVAAIQRDVHALARRCGNAGGVVTGGKQLARRRVGGIFSGAVDAGEAPGGADDRGAGGVGFGVGVE